MKAVVGVGIVVFGYLAYLYTQKPSKRENNHLDFMMQPLQPEQLISRRGNSLLNEIESIPGNLLNFLENAWRLIAPGQAPPDTPDQHDSYYSGARGSAHEPEEYDV